jgi:hypothetical protein
VVYSERIGNSFSPNGLAIGSSRHLSAKGDTAEARWWAAMGTRSKSSGTVVAYGPEGRAWKIVKRPRSSARRIAEGTTGLTQERPLSEGVSARR